MTVDTFTYTHFRRRRPLMLLWPLWKRMLAKRDLAGKCRLSLSLFFFVSLRHALSLEYLSRHRGEYQNVLLTDCRDVYFQRDPFMEPIKPGIHVYLEEKGQYIGTNPSNARMVATAFGPEVLIELADFPVSCAGTTLGDEESIYTYLQTMVETLCTIRKMTQSNDQGVHNFVVRRNLVPGTHVHDNYSERVFTAGCEWEENIRLNQSNEVVRPDGGVYAVLHQHDRFPGLLKKLLAKLKE